MAEELPARRGERGPVWQEVAPVRVWFRNVLPLLLRACAVSLTVGVALPGMALAGMSISERHNGISPLGCVTLNNPGQLLYCGHSAVDLWQIYLYQPATATSPAASIRLSHQPELVEPQADLNDVGQVVWAAGATGARHIFFYDGAGAARISVDGDNRHPRLNNTGQVVWEWSPPGGTGSAIVRYDIATGALTPVSNPGTAMDLRPDINDSGQMVWMRRTLYSSSLMRLDAIGGTPATVPDSGQAGIPRINNPGHVAWAVASGPGGGIHLHDGMVDRIIAATGTDGFLSPAYVSLNDQDEVMWTAPHSATQTGQLFRGGIAGVAQLTTTFQDNAFPSINDGGHFAWVQQADDGYRLLSAFDDPNLTPGSELCNGLDDDLDGEIDEFQTVDGYTDADGDGWGVLPPARVCRDTPGYTARWGDCDDTDPQVYPQAMEVCNGVDDNCDGRVDEGVDWPYFRDADGDGYGHSASTTRACATPPPGFSANPDDCDDTDPAIHPLAVEVCNLLDDNCNGRNDEYVCNTTAGSDVLANAGPVVDVLFSVVSLRGETVAVIRDDAPPLPDGYTGGIAPVYYDISTSALFAGEAIVCMAPEPGRFAPDADLRLLHWDAVDQAWRDLPQVAGLPTTQVCGVTASFSTFTLAAAMPPPPSPPAPGAEPGAGGGCAVATGVASRGDGLTVMALLALLSAALRGRGKRKIAEG